MNSLPILSIVTWLPTLGAIVILALFKKEQASLIKKFATAWFGVAFVASLALLKYDRALGGMQFLEDHQWIPVIGARYQMGVDGVAVLLIVLTTLLGVIAALSSWKYIEKREKEYYALLLLLQTAVVGVFTSMDLFLFYLFFEVSLVPMYFLIGIWGGKSFVCGHQILPLYPRRLGRNAAGRLENIFLDPGHCTDRPDHPGND